MTIPTNKIKLNIIKKIANPLGTFNFTNLFKIGSNAKAMIKPKKIGAKKAKFLNKPSHKFLVCSTKKKITIIINILISLKSIFVLIFCPAF